MTKQIRASIHPSTKPLHNDLSLFHWGYERCKNGHSFGPAVRDHYLIHYILEGKGKFKVGDKIYYLREGQGFLICPDIVTFYQADLETPWYYAWVGFYGENAKEYLSLSNLNEDRPIFDASKDKYIEQYLLRMGEIDGFSESESMELTGLLYLFLSRLIDIASSDSNSSKTGNQKAYYVDRAIQYIERNYSRNFTISSLADYIGIDRKYLCQLFNESLDTTPQQFLINYRVDKAISLLGETNLYIGDIARSVGYKDPLQFSKMFKKVKGISPKYYRERLVGE